MAFKMAQIADFPTVQVIRMRLLFRLQSARCPIVSQSHLAAGHSELVGGIAGAGDNRFCMICVKMNGADGTGKQDHLAQHPVEQR